MFNSLYLLILKDLQVILDCTNRNFIQRLGRGFFLSNIFLKHLKLTRFTRVHILPKITSTRTTYVFFRASPFAKKGGFVFHTFPSIIGHIFLNSSCRCSVALTYRGNTLDNTNTNVPTVFREGSASQRCSLLWQNPVLSSQAYSWRPISLLQIFPLLMLGQTFVHYSNIRNSP